MTRKSLSIEALSQESLKELAQLGSNIKIARTRRRIKQSDMAERILVTEKTYRKIEAGDPSVSLGLFFHVLLVLNLEDDILKIADPNTDTVGLMMEKRNMPKKIRNKVDKELDF